MTAVAHLRDRFGVDVAGEDDPTLEKFFARKAKLISERYAGEAELVTFALATTGLVVMGKVALLAPAAMLTLAGTVAAAVLLLVSVMVVAAAARPVRVTVPVEEVPPVTLVGLSATEASTAGVTLSVVVRVAPP